jgi:hypothetical protein
LLGKIWVGKRGRVLLTVISHAVYPSGKGCPPEKPEHPGKRMCRSTEMPPKVGGRRKEEEGEEQVKKEDQPLIWEVGVRKRGRRRKEMGRGYGNG